MIAAGAATRAGIARAADGIAIENQALLATRATVLDS